MKMKKLAAICLALVMLLGLCCFGNAFAAAEGEAAPTVLANWAEDSPAMRSITAFVESSVDEASQGYIPKPDRIAVFDMDGTLYGERFPTYFNDWLFIQRALYDESYDAPEELKEFARAWEDKVLKGVPIDDFDAKERELGPKLYEGLTADEYADVVRAFKAMDVYGEGLGQLASGRGNIIRRVRGFKDLDVPAAVEIPDDESFETEGLKCIDGSGSAPLARLRQNMV
jgi:hypothetical protein